MRPTGRNARVGLCLIIAIFLSGSPAIAQSFDVVTMVDGTAAKALRLQRNNHLPKAFLPLQLCMKPSRRFVKTAVSIM